MFADNFSSVVITGGCCKIPAIADYAKKRYPHTSFVESHELNHPVAYGALFKGSLLSGLEIGQNDTVNDAINREVALVDSYLSQTAHKMKNFDLPRKVEIDSGIEYKIFEQNGKSSAIVGEIPGFPWYYSLFRQLR
mgnify:CR=1 FL=1